MNYFNYTLLNHHHRSVILKLMYCPPKRRNCLAFLHVAEEIIGVANCLFLFFTSLCILFFRLFNYLSFSFLSFLIPEILPFFSYFFFILPSFLCLLSIFLLLKFLFSFPSFLFFPPVLSAFLSWKWPKALSSEPCPKILSKCMNERYWKGATASSVGQVFTFSCQFI